MPALLPPRRFRSDRAEVGVGTLIVFIAMVLVAAVAAAVIIGTSGALQQRAQMTGQEATAEVSSNLLLNGMYGVRNDTSRNLWTIQLYLQLAAGSKEVDLNQTIIRYNDGQNQRTYKHDSSESGFGVTWVRGTNTTSVMKSGDLVEVHFQMLDGELAPRSGFDLALLPTVGQPLLVSLKTPPTYVDDLYVNLK